MTPSAALPDRLECGLSDVAGRPVAGRAPATRRLTRVDTRSEWNDVCCEFGDAEFTQSFEWGEARRLEGWRPTPVVLRDGDRPVAAALLLVKSRFGVELVYCPRGPVWQRRDRPTAASLASLAAMLDALCGAYRNSALVCDWYSDREQIPESMLRPKGFRRITDGMTAIIELDATMESILASFHRKWRNDLQKAREGPLRVSCHVPPDHVDELYALADRMTVRKRFSIGVSHALATSFLRERNGEASALVRAVNPDGTTAAAALIVVFNGMASYLVGASVSNEDPAFSRGASNLVQWHALGWAKASGAHLYNLEGLDPLRNPGVYHFKSRMNGRPRLTRGMWIWTRNRVATAVLQTALKRIIS